jgi:hypothetical protein
MSPHVRPDEVLRIDCLLASDRLLFAVFLEADYDMFRGVFEADELGTELYHNAKASLQALSKNLLYRILRKNEGLALQGP